MNARENRRGNQEWTIQRKPKGQSRMDNPETKETQNGDKQNKTKLQHRNCSYNLKTAYAVCYNAMLYYLSDGCALSSSILLCVCMN